MRVITSFSSLRNFEYEGISSDRILKRYAILFEEVIFDPWGVGNQNLIKFIMGAAQRGTLDMKNDSYQDLQPEFKRTFLNLWETVVDTDAFEKRRRAFTSDNSTYFDGLGDFCWAEVKALHGENLTREQYKEVKYLVEDVWTDVGLNELGISEGLNTVPSYSPLIGRALRKEVTSRAPCIHDVFSSDLIVPDFDKLSWSQVFELRADKHVKAFRKVIHNYLKPDSKVDDAYALGVSRDLWKLVSDIEPSIQKSIISGVLSNVPFLPINPVGIGLAAKDVSKTREIERRFGHLFFVQKLKASISPPLT